MIARISHAGPERSAAQRTAGCFALTILLLLLAGKSHAQSVHLILPEHGNYQVGQFMPIEIVADDEASRNAAIMLRADGALQTTVLMNGKQSVTAAMLMLNDGARNLRWESNGSSHAVNFPLQVQQDSGNELLPPRAVMGSIGGLDAYSPVLSWHPGASSRTRRVAILIATLTSIFLVAIALLVRSSRIKIVATALVVVAAIFGIEIWRRSIPPIFSATGQIVIAGRDSTQIDTWQYFTARSNAPLRIMLIDGAIPVFINADHARAINARLTLDGATSTTTLECDLPADFKLAICSRRISSAKIDGAPSDSISSPMRALAERVYVDRDTSIIGEGEVAGVSDQDVRYRAVILKSR